MTKPITMKKALQVLRGAAELTTVDIVIQHVNSRFATQAEMLRHRCDPKLGHFYTVFLDRVATIEECLAIEAAFKPHWEGVKVVYWQGRLSIHLSCVEDREWTSYYNGKQIFDGAAPGDSSQKKAA
jgi:hypothetical protein